jgi:C4-dicarboxylate-specific signal transduction histidine kinase
MAQLFQLDLVVLFPLGHQEGNDERIRQWSRLKQAVCTGDGDSLFPWTHSRMAAGAAIVCDALDTLPPEAAIDRERFASAGLGAMVVVPLFLSGGSVYGGLAAASAVPRVWQSAEIAQIRLFAEILAHARAREEAEVDAQRARQDLSQVSRLVSMGELTSSLAHELNQPLTGILSNAQTAERVLRQDKPAIDELRAIVGDIIEDNRRAGAVIRRMREMVARADRPPILLDLNGVVREVAALISSDAIIKNVSVTVDFPRDPVFVRAVRVDLLQAVLSVITHGMEAVAGRPVADRRVEVAVNTSGEQQARIIVRDAGRGLPPGAEHRVFDSVLTVKDGGAGLGLPIARSIVDSQGGRITAANHPAGGAVITIELPRADVELA